MYVKAVSRSPARLDFFMRGLPLPCLEFCFLLPSAWHSIAVPIFLVSLSPLFYLFSWVFCFGQFLVSNHVNEPSLGFLSKDVQPSLAILIFLVG